MSTETPDTTGRTATIAVEVDLDAYDQLRDDGVDVAQAIALWNVLTNPREVLAAHDQLDDGGEPDGE